MRNKRLEKEVQRLQDELDLYKQSFNNIEVPEEDIKTLKTKLKLGDKDTMTWIIDYLRHDSIKLVMNLAKTVNSENAASVIAFRD